MARRASAFFVLIRFVLIRTSARWGMRFQRKEDERLFLATQMRSEDHPRNLASEERFR
jgi:hypothetical protein